MSTPDLPVFNILITPHFDDTPSTSTYLSISITVGGLNGGLLRGNQPTFSKDLLTTSGSETQQNVFRNFKISDDKKGHVRFVTSQGAVEEVPKGRERDVIDVDVVVGYDDQAKSQEEETVRISYDACPFLSQDTSSEILCLVRDQEGLAGTGHAVFPLSLLPLLPLPPNVGTTTTTTKTTTTTTCLFIVQWDFSYASRAGDIRAVHSLGQGDCSWQGDMQSLYDFSFMVGLVNCLSLSSAADSCSSCCCAVYYFGELPGNLAALGPFIDGMARHLASFFFRDESSKKCSLFLRRSTVTKLRSTTLGRVALVDYEDGAVRAMHGQESGSESEWELVRVITRALVSVWARLDREEDGEGNAWFTQGIAHLYSIYLPFRFKFYSPDYFRATLNGYLLSHYTNPHIRVPLRELPSPKSAWHVNSAQDMRACIYMIRMDAFTRRASVAKNAGVERPIDEMMREISLRRQRGETVRTKEWLALVGEWIGLDVAEKHFSDMENGVFMDLEDMKTGFGGSLVAEQHRVLDMGFSRNSLGTGIVEGVRGGSNASEAGLCDGDVIRWYLRPELVEEGEETEYKMTVVGLKGEQDLAWLPRSNEKVKTWQSRKKDT